MIHQGMFQKRLWSNDLEQHFQDIVLEHKNNTFSLLQAGRFQCSQNGRL